MNFREDACTKMEQILNERFQKECGQEVDHELVSIPGTDEISGIL